jgi:hypothetical protein
VVEQIAKLGEEETRGISTEDVTEQTIDLDARIAVQQARVDSGRRLLAEAKSLNDLVMLEKEVATRESDLASLQAKKRRLADLTALSTITVVLLDPDAAPATEPDGPPGFLAGLAGGWSALLASLAVLVTVLGAILPWLIALGLPAWGILWAYRRYARRRPARVAPAPALVAPAPAYAGPAPTHPGHARPFPPGHAGNAPLYPGQTTTHPAPAADHPGQTAGHHGPAAGGPPPPVGGPGPRPADHTSHATAPPADGPADRSADPEPGQPAAGSTPAAGTPASADPSTTESAPSAPAPPDPEPPANSPDR